MNRNLLICRLIQLRQEMEAEADICQIEIPLPLALHDVCVYLKLTKEERNSVLGPHGVACVEAFMNSTAAPLITVSLPLVQPATVSRN